MESFIAVFLILGISFIVFICVQEISKGKYLNKGWTDKNLIVEPPTFIIEKVERTRGCNNVCWVGKYTAECWYKTKKSADFSTIVFYDNLNKYNVGDKLTLMPEIENS